MDTHIVEARKILRVKKASSPFDLNRIFRKKALKIAQECSHDASHELTAIRYAYQVLKTYLETTDFRSAAQRKADRLRDCREWELFLKQMHDAGTTFESTTCEEIARKPHADKLERPDDILENDMAQNDKPRVSDMPPDVCLIAVHGNGESQNISDQNTISQIKVAQVKPVDIHADTPVTDIAEPNQNLIRNPLSERIQKAWQNPQIQTAYIEKDLRPHVTSEEKQYHALNLPEKSSSFEKIVLWTAVSISLKSKTNMVNKKDVETLIDQLFGKSLKLAHNEPTRKCRKKGFLILNGSSKWVVTRAGVCRAQALFGEFRPSKRIPHHPLYKFGIDTPFSRDKHRIPEIE